MLPNIEIIVGTYTDYLIGYQLVSKQENGKDKPYLKQTFADKSHAGSLKCVAVQAPWIASGGSDDRIFIYNMRVRKQSAILDGHAGTINAMSFSPDLTHLISVSADGGMIATRVAKWQTEGHWRKAHAGSPVTHVACHPSSRLAFSLGGDLVLNTWNMVKGRVAYRTNLKSNPQLGRTPDCLSWSPDGNHFTLCGPLVIEIWSIETASVVRSTKLNFKPICVAWLNELNCLVGLENGSTAWICMEEDDAPKLIETHESRVKSMCYLNDTLVTISSAGEIKVWVTNVDEKSLKEVCSLNINCRPTCLGLLDLNQCGNSSQDDNADESNTDQQQKAVKRSADKDDDDEDDCDGGKQPKYAKSKIVKSKRFVSIEEEEDENTAKKVPKGIDISAKSKQKKKKPQKKNKPKNRKKHSTNSNEAESGSDSNSDSDMNSGSDDDDDDDENAFDSSSDSEPSSKARGKRNQGKPKFDKQKPKKLTKQK